MIPDQYLQMEQSRIEQRTKYEPLWLGIIMGALLAFIGIVVVINVINHLTPPKTKTFIDFFPVWRGASEMVWYIWILGLCTLFYEKSGINYKLIFHFEKHNFPRSRFLFLLASIFSFLYLLLFSVFLLEINEIISSRFKHYGEVFWLIFLGYIFNPLPILHHKGRFYMLRMIWKQIFSFCYPMNFLMIWIAEQIVSLTQPLTDFFYTVYFFFSGDPKLTKLVTPNVNSGIVITVFFYRMYQNFKFWL
jgi:hypothetical protein